MLKKTSIWVNLDKQYYHAITVYNNKTYYLVYCELCCFLELLLLLLLWGLSLNLWISPIGEKLELYCHSERLKKKNIIFNHILLWVVDFFNYFIRWWCCLDKKYWSIYPHYWYTQYKWKEMTGVLGHDSALSGYTGPRTTWANEMNFVMNHTLAGSIEGPVD